MGKTLLGTKLTSADPDSTLPRGTCTVANLCPCCAEWSRPALASLIGSSRWQARIMHRLSPLQIVNQKNPVNVTTAWSVWHGTSKTYLWLNSHLCDEKPVSKWFSNGMVSSKWQIWHWNESHRSENWILKVYKMLIHEILFTRGAQVPRAGLPWLLHSVWWLLIF